MSTVSSRSPARRAVRRIASSPAVAGFRPAGIALALAAAFGLHAQAQAQNAGAVVFGQGTVTHSGANTHVNITANGGSGLHSVTDWTRLAVPFGSRTDITQPSAASTSINRVFGSPTEIFGTLHSNGKVVLVNPAGITVGRGATVDTAGFTASTLAMSREDAFAGRLRFAGGNGVLTLDGQTTITRGDVFLVASAIDGKAGSVVANQNGSIVLAAGQKVELTGRGLEGIRMEVQAPENEVVNLGTLSGDAVGVFAGTLKHSGQINAQAVSAEGGRVVLKSLGDALVSGGVVASKGDQGGRIDVLGDRVALLDGAKLQASGRLGGGSVRVGGDYQGANAQVPNARRTYVDANARIEANATDSGDGGRVIVWSDEATRMHGRIEARGGAAGGNGGFAEVSGKHYLEFAGSADLRAPAGQAGTLLLDPNDIVIEVNGPTNTTTTGNVFSGGTGMSKIKESDLEAQLANSSVIVATNNGTGGTGLITVATGVNLAWSTNNALGLQADGAIDFQGSIDATGSGSALSLRAFNGDISQNTSSSVIRVGALQILADTGSVFLEGQNQVGTVGGTAGGTFSLTNATGLVVGTASSPYGAAQSGITSGGDVRLTVNSGDLVLNQGVKAGPDSQVSLKVATGNVVQNTTSSVITATRLLAQATQGSVSLNGANQVDVLAAELFGAGKSFSFNNAKALTIGGVFGPNESTIGGISAAGSITVTTTAGNLVVADQVVESDGGGSVTLNAAGNVDLGTSSQVKTFRAPISITAGGSIAGAGSLATFGSTTADGVAGGVTLKAAGTIDVASINTASSDSASPHGGNVTMTAGSDITVDNIQTNGSGFAGNGGAVSATTGGAIDISWISAYGGGSFADSVGAGSGGTVNLAGGMGVASDFIDTHGGSYGASTGAARGGMAGNVSVTAASGNVDIGSIDANGGDGFARSATENVGQSGGTVSLAANKGSVTVGDVSALGGEGFGTVTGGTGGNVTIVAANDITLTADSFGGTAIVADGGVSDAGTGGNGGRVELKLGGSVLVVSGPRTEVLVTEVLAEGSPFAVVSASGGAGADQSSGTAGGAGGTVRIERTNSGPLVVDSSLMLVAMGGEGGDATASTGTGAAGGAGGNIDLVSGGAVHLRSPFLLAQGGGGGSNFDGSVQAASGALGFLRAAGTSVEVEGDLFLAAIWGNNAVVNLRDASVVAGIGRFDNFGQVVLHGTSALAPDAGVFNNASLSSVGTDNLVHLKHNSGIVDVAAGSKLSAHGFFSNAGTVQANGTLDIGIFTPAGASAPTPPSDMVGATGAFINEAAGVLTGTGNIIVDGGAGTIDNFGTIAPGGAGTVGTLTLTSSLIMEAGSTMAADLQSPTSHDVLAVTGTARTGGAVEVTSPAGTTFPAGEVFSVLRSGGLDAATLPTVNKPELRAEARGNELVLVANSAPAPAAAPSSPELEQVNNQVVTFAQYFLQEAERQQEEEAKRNEIGKDDIVVTDTACTPR